MERHCIGQSLGSFEHISRLSNFQKCVFLTLTELSIISNTTTVLSRTHTRPKNSRPHIKIHPKS